MVRMLLDKAQVGALVLENRGVPVLIELVPALQHDDIRLKLADYPGYGLIFG
jgi:hypothetical protein